MQIQAESFGGKPEGELEEIALMETASALGANLRWEATAGKLVSATRKVVSCA